MQQTLPWAAFALLAASLLAGCSSGDGGADPGGHDLPPGTGALCGVVVDQTITPVEGATARSHDGHNATTDEAGAFCIEGLTPGDAFVTVSKPGYATMQASGTVPDGAEGSVGNLMIEKLVDQQPALETFKFSGFYECGFGAPVIVDSCDFGVRTVSDAVNETTGQRLPRGVQSNTNTVFMDIPPTASTIIQEGVWDNPDVPEMMIELSSTPIDNSCDCSDRYFLEAVGPSPTYGRVDEEAVPKGETVAVRGFLPFGDPSVALNHEFEVFTTVFQFYSPPEGWSYVNGDEVPF